MQNKNTSKNANTGEKDPCLFCLYRWECAKEKEIKENDEVSDSKCGKNKTGLSTSIL